MHLVHQFKFSKNAVSGTGFCAKFEVILQNEQLLSVVAGHSKSDFCTVNWVADGEDIH